MIFLPNTGRQPFVQTQHSLHWTQNQNLECKLETVIEYQLKTLHTQQTILVMNNRRFSPRILKLKRSIGLLILIPGIIKNKKKFSFIQEVSE